MHDSDAHWRHLANTVEPSMCGGDVACCQITLSICLIMMIIIIIIIRRHRSTTYLDDAANRYRPSSVICLSVCWSVCLSSKPCKKRLN